MNGYSGGRIKKIKIQNFMTYDDVDLYPKKGLNLIVGLNGSGKSSIMCAICLGLAGKPHFTGRATQLSDFIKHGEQEANIEIELESIGRKNVVIHRKLKGDRCEWTLNNSPSNQNEVAKAVKRFNIDTSNLCQFLPQEKVVEFSRMDKKQRLENMLQAIGEPHLFKLFNELKDLFKELIDVEQTVKKHESTKTAAEIENEKISDEVQKQEGRVRLKAELDELEKQKKIVIYQEVYEEVKSLKDEERELQAEVEELRKEKNEATTQEDFFLHSYQNCNSKFKQLDSRKKKFRAKMSEKTDSLTNFKEQVETAEIEYRNRLNEKDNQKKRLQDLKKQVEALEKTLSEEMQKESEYNERENAKLEALAIVQTAINELHQRMGKISTEKNQLEYRVMSYKNQLSSLQNEQNKKMANLKRVCKYTHEAACWLQEHRNQFKSNVYLPIMLEINIKSQNYAKYVENVIGFRDMIAFVCEDKKDCERLTEVLKEQKKLPVNIVMAPDDQSKSSYTSPVLSREHKQYGLDCFIIDLFTAPEPVMRYLCACYGIHRIPVTTSVISGNTVELILQSYTIFFSENMRVSGKRSRYGNKNLSVKKDFITDKKFLMNSNDDLKKREIEAECCKYEEEIEEKRQKLEVLKNQLAEKEKYQDTLRAEKKMWQEKKKNIDNLKQQYLLKKKLQQNLIPVGNEEEEKSIMIRKINSINELQERVLSDINVLFRDFMQTEKEIVVMILCMNVFSKDLKLAIAANEDIKDKVRTAETELEKITRDYREKKRKGRQLLEDIKRMGEEYKNYWEGSQPSTIDLSMDEIEHKMNHIQAQLNLNEDNEPLVNEYNSRKRKIEEIQQKINNFQVNVSKLRQDIQKKKKEWLQPLQHHIGNINRKFSHYFKELNCVGEISLDIPENPDDFTKYGLRINLKFHDEESSLCELSQTRHSGGECSVAAIVFILSLQELTEVPFRCIDEINQGMDSVNERKIYQLIYDSVADDRCSQYFLLTPKLLMDLDYPEDVAVHVIFNSPFLQLKLDVKEHLKIEQEKMDEGN